MSGSHGALTRLYDRGCSLRAELLQKPSALDLQVDGERLDHSTTKQLQLGNVYFGRGDEWDKALDCFKAQVGIEGRLAALDKCVYPISRVCVR